jgi:SPP1 gp7 family putative phage head morphogenesis protein
LGDGGNFKRLNKGGVAIPWTKILTKEQRAGIWRAFDNSAFVWEKKFKKITINYFNDQLEAVFKTFPDAKQLSKSMPMQHKKKVPDPDEILDWTEENKKLLAKLSPGWIAAAEQGYKAATEAFGFDLKFDLIRDEMFKWIDSRGAEQVKRINDTTKEAIRNTLSSGIAGGENIPELRGRVEQVFTDASGYRAEMIARTETHNTVSNGSFLTYGQAGVEKKEYLATMDDRVRDSHAAMDGEIRPINEPFSNGLMFPGDPSGPAEEVINCRCTLLPVVE